jgi:rhodanese-related sulfurtransferase
MDDIPRIAPEDVLTAMHRGERIVFVDARSEKAWSTATEQIPGSIRISPDDIDRHAGQVPGGAMVVAYCT